MPDKWIIPVPRSGVEEPNHPGLVCDDVSRTQQNFKDECDINVIVKRFGLGGQLPVGLVVPQYADFEEIVDFHTAMNTIRAAEESFNQLPPDVRSRFRNDPGELVSFVSDESNRAEAEKLGIVVRGGGGLSTPAPTEAPTLTGGGAGVGNPT